MRCGGGATSTSSAACCRVSEYFGRMRKRIRLDHLDVHHLRKFMETHGQEMGYSVTQFAMRAGHDPRIAA